MRLSTRVKSTDKRAHMNNTKLLTYQLHPSILFCGMKHELSQEQPGLSGFVRLSFLPSAATANVTVKLLFSAPQDFTGTVRLDGILNRIGVSSILKILDKGYPRR